MNVLVCVKRVPAAAGKMTLTPDEQDIDTRFLGFTVSPHEECAVEEAVRLIEKHGGESAVLTLGPEEAIQQLQDAMALGVDRGILIPSDGIEWDPQATARAIVEAVGRQRDGGFEFDLLLFGNEAADSGDYQVGVRVAHALGVPCVTGVKGIEVDDGKIRARREASGGWDVFEVTLPAVISVKEGINLPRYPSIPGRLKARRKPIERIEVRRDAGGLEKQRLIVPQGQGRRVEILGHGPDAAPRAVEVLKGLGVIRS
jgi:electron transfer flavoprotein beta subunit